MPAFDVVEHPPGHVDLVVLEVRRADTGEPVDCGNCHAGRIDAVDLLEPSDELRVVDRVAHLAEPAITFESPAPWFDLHLNRWVVARVVKQRHGRSFRPLGRVQRAL